MIRHLEPLLVALLAAAVLFAPLAFGGVAPWAAAALDTVAFLALAVAALRSRSLDYFSPVRGAAFALAGLALVGALQLLPWPRPLAKLVASRHVEIQDQASALLGGPAEVSFVQLTLAQGSTLRTTLHIAALAALLAAAAVAGRHSRDRLVLAAAVVAAATFNVLYGMRRWLSGVSSIWDVPVAGSADRLRGTFVNPDHFAFYLELALPVVFAWSWWAARRARWAETTEARLLLVGPPVMAWCALFVALAFSGSRAGLAAAILGALVQSALLAQGKRRWQGLALGLGLVVVGLFVVGALGARFGFGRLLATSTYELGWGSRLQAAVATLGLVRQFPLTGSGLGTFEDGFPMVQPPELAGLWLHAHSDPVELLATAGLVGFALAAAGLGWLLFSLRRVWKQGDRSEDRAAALAACGLLTSTLAHEFVDFGLTMPANAFTLAVIVGAASAARLAPPEPPPAAVES